MNPALRALAQRSSASNRVAGLAARMPTHSVMQWFGALDTSVELTLRCAERNHHDDTICTLTATTSELCVPAELGVLGSRRADCDPDSEELPGECPRRAVPAFKV